MASIDESDVPLLWCEGEKDVLVAEAMGFVATTSPFGASAFTPEVVTVAAEHLFGRHVCLIPHNDTAGHAYASDVGRELIAIACPVRWLDLPVPEKGGDLSDWENQGGTGEELMRLVATAPRWTPPADVGYHHDPAREIDSASSREGAFAQSNSRLTFMTAREFAMQTPATTEWVVEPFVPMGGVTKFDGQPKTSGKTTFACRMIAAVLGGTSFLATPDTGPVVLMSEQGGLPGEALAGGVAGC